MAGRRDRLAAAMRRTGLLKLVEALPQRPQLIVLSYHRIGRREDTVYDRELFSTDAEGLAEQIALIKRRFELLHPAEALEVLGGKRALQRTAVLLTFDDGYRDNLTDAMPVLNALGASAIFFLVTGYLDDPHQTPWWDRIAYLVRQSVGTRLVMTEPDSWSAQVTEANVDRVISALMWRYRNLHVNAARFIEELTASAGTHPAPPTDRLFLDWDEARELMARDAMIGLHTQSHEILSKLDPERQRWELATSRARMKQHLGYDCDVMAYPVGTINAFTPATKSFAQETGYKYAFSLHGGSNVAGNIDSFDIRRVSLPAYAPPARNRLALSIMSATRSVWY